MKKIWIVAEIGCNHNGNEETARQMVDKAKNCGVDAVKFQTFRASELISVFAPKAEYQKKTTGEQDSQLEMTAKLELPKDAFIRLRDYALSIGLDVFSTPFDMGSIDFLHASGQYIWKIPSGEITNLPYLKKIGELECKNKHIILSTGMSTIEEIKTCLHILHQGGTSEEQITILHCNTEYPTPDEDVNLLAILTLKRNFPKYKIGLSDHSTGYTAATAAVPLGITMIEKHFTLDKNLPGPDHKASATPDEMLQLVNNVRRAENMLGSGEKIVSTSERGNKIVARKSIVAKKEIRAGEKFTEENITCKRPGNGISPMKWYNIIGKTAEKNFEIDELISCEEFKWQET